MSNCLNCRWLVGGLYGECVAPTDQGCWYEGPEDSRDLYDDVDPRVQPCDDVDGDCSRCPTKACPPPLKWFCLDCGEYRTIHSDGVCHECAAREEQERWEAEQDWDVPDDYRYTFEERWWIFKRYVRRLLRRFSPKRRHDAATF